MHCPDRRRVWMVPAVLLTPGTYRSNRPQACFSQSTAAASWGSAASCRLARDQISLPFLASERARNYVVPRETKGTGPDELARPECSSADLSSVLCSRERGCFTGAVLLR